MRPKCDINGCRGRSGVRVMSASVIGPHIVAQCPAPISPMITADISSESVMRYRR
jgi:hypothetical protein